MAAVLWFKMGWFVSCLPRTFVGFIAYLLERLNNRARVAVCATVDCIVCCTVGYTRRTAGGPPNRAVTGLTSTLLHHCCASPMVAREAPAFPFTRRHADRPTPTFCLITGATWRTFPFTRRHADRPTPTFCLITGTTWRTCT